MSVLSKIINLKLRDHSCRTIVHPGETCTQAMFRNFINYFLSSAKFYLPVVLIQLAMKIKGINGQLVFDHVKYFFEMCYASCIVGSAVSTLPCIFRRVMGKFHYNTIVLAPAILASLLSITFTKRVSRMFAVCLLQVMIESQLRWKRNPITRAINKSKSLQTFLFMISSSIILHILGRNKKFKVFWFMKPLQQNFIIEKNNILEKSDINMNNEKEHEEKDESSSVILLPDNDYDQFKKCKHDGNCINFSYQGIKSYFLIGFALETLKMITSKPKQKSINFFNLILNKIKNFNYDSIKFLVSYVGFYRSSYCLLNNYLKNIDPNIIHILSALFGGISYSFYSKPIIFTYALVISFELLWRQYAQKQKQKHNKTKFDKIILKFNMPQLIIIPTMSLLIEWYIFRNDLINSLGANIVNAATNYRGKQMHNRLKVISGGYDFK